MTPFEPAPPPPPIRTGSIRARALALVDVPLGLESRMVEILEGRVERRGGSHRAPHHCSPPRRTAAWGADAG